MKHKISILLLSLLMLAGLLLSGCCCCGDECPIRKLLGYKSPQTEQTSDTTTPQPSAETGTK